MFINNYIDVNLFQLKFHYYFFINNHMEIKQFHRIFLSLLMNGHIIITHKSVNMNNKFCSPQTYQHFKDFNYCPNPRCNNKKMTHLSQFQC